MALMFGAWQAGILDRFGSPEKIKATLLELGPSAYVIFVLAFGLLQPFGLPATAFIWGAPLVWDWPVAFALSMAGTLIASVVGFSFARFVARDWVTQRIPRSWHRYEEAVERRAFATVFWLRLIFWMPPPLHFFFAVTKVGFWIHLAASFLGYIPPLLFVSYFGDDVLIILLQQHWTVWVALGLVILAIPALVVRRQRRRMNRSE
jgi:uncharacterized membrane protein YdjX (TVP38/TMEM64 family)